MKIFSQSTACALIAVANAGARADVSTNANHHVYLRDTSLLGYFPDQATAQQPIAPFISTNGQLSCVGVPRRSRDKNIVHCTYELYGGWDFLYHHPRSQNLNILLMESLVVLWVIYQEEVKWERWRGLTVRQMR